MQNSYDRRIVNYESIHGLKEHYFDLMADAIKPLRGERILDVGAGYGAATRELIHRNKETDIQYVLLEKSNVQLDRAKKVLSNITGPAFFGNNIAFVNGAIQNHPFESGSFNKVIAKSFIHEIPKNEKVSSFRSIKDMLKADGRFIIWNYILDDINCDYVRDMIRKKDELAGYDALVNDRHFPTEKELLNDLNDAGFSDVQEIHSFDYTHNSLSRLGEFNNDQSILNTYNKYLLEKAGELDNKTKENLKLNYEKNNVTVVIKQSILTAGK